MGNLCLFCRNGLLLFQTIDSVKTNFSDPNKSKIFDPLNSLVGMSGDSREWRYLNKGTHEENDRAEFDRNTVSEIILALERLDQAL